MELSTAIETGIFWLFILSHTTHHRSQTLCYLPCKSCVNGSRELSKELAQLPIGVEHNNNK